MDQSTTSKMCDLFNESKACLYLFSTEGKLIKEHFLRAEIFCKYKMRFRGSTQREFVYLYKKIGNHNESHNTRIDSTLRNIQLSAIETDRDLISQIKDLDKILNKYGKGNKSSRSLSPVVRKSCVMSKKQKHESSKIPGVITLSSDSLTSTLESPCQSMNVPSNNENEATAVGTNSNACQESEEFSGNEIKTHSPCVTSRSITAITRPTEDAFSLANVVNEKVDNDKVIFHAINFPDMLHFTRVLVDSVNAYLLSHPELNGSFATSVLRIENHLPTYDEMNEKKKNDCSSKRKYSIISPTSKKPDITETDANDPEKVFRDLLDQFNNAELSQAYDLVCKRRSVSEGKLFID